MDSRFERGKTPHDWSDDGTGAGWHRFRPHSLRAIYLRVVKGVGQKTYRWMAWAVRHDGVISPVEEVEGYADTLERAQKAADEFSEQYRERRG
jgi:hypothetical protein